MAEQRVTRNRRIFSIFAWLSIVLIAVAGFKGHRFSYLLILQIIVGLMMIARELTALLSHPE
jgi:hypothetical protein